MGSQDQNAVHIEVNVDESGRILSQKIYNSEDVASQIEQSILLGYSALEIAKRLNITEQTVRTYHSKILSRYKLKTTKRMYRRIVLTRRETRPVRPPFNAEYVLYLLLRKDEREVVVGDLIEGYEEVFQRFNERRANIWFYKQVCGSLWPFIRRGLLKIGTLVWLGRILRRMIS